MRKKLLLLALFMLGAVPCFAQQVDTAWVRRYSGTGNNTDAAYAIAVDGSGNVYVTGASYGSGTSYDYATIKHDPSGTQLWVQRYNGLGNSDDEAYAIAVDGSGNVYVTGWSMGSGTGYDYATIKYYPNGDTAWVRRYNGPGNNTDEAHAIAVDGSGNVYVTGESYGSGTSYDYATIKYYPNGDTAWVRRYNGPGNSDDVAWAIAVDGSGNVYVTGASKGSGTSLDYATLKYDSAGAQLWFQRYNGPGNSVDVATAIAVDGSGNVHVTGASTGSGALYDYATIKYDPVGTQLWVPVPRYNGPGNSDDVATAIAVDGSGNVYVTGYSWGSGTNNDYATLKYDPVGNQLWFQRYNGPGNSIDEAHAIAVDSSGNVYVTGWSTGSGTSWDYTTLKYDPAGTQSWEKRYNGPGNSDDLSHAIAVDSSGNVYVTGQSNGSGTGYDYATIKYLQFLCGDANGDGKVTVSDVIYLINYLFKGGPPPVPVKAGDVNCDGKDTVSDVVYTVNYLFKGGPKPCQSCP